jgi:hypothetical protein
MRRSVPALFIAIALSGCSFGMDRVNSPYSPTRAPSCNESAAAPALDLIAAPVVVLTGLFAALAVEQNGCGSEGDCGTFDPGLSVLSLIAGGLYLTSSVSGFRARARCRRAYAAHRAWRRAGRPADPRTVIEKRDRRERAECKRWRAELAAASTDDQKRALVRRRPTQCE